MRSRYRNHPGGLCVVRDFQHTWLQYNNILALYNTHIPANTRPCPIVGSMLGQRRRRWSNFEPTMGQWLVFAVMWLYQALNHYHLPRLITLLTIELKI